MSTLEFSLLVIIGLIIVEQAGAVVLFAIACKWIVRRQPTDHFPSALVILPLRGADPSLSQCIRGIAGQNYPKYRVCIVVDNPQDPARKVVEQVLAEAPAPHVEMRVLENPRTTCSLKCSAVYQATENLDDSIDVVATIDSDIIPHPDWLRDMVAPLKDRRVGAAMGNRWYAPPIGRLGSLICYLWNAAVVVSMYFNRVPWGGSLAIDANLLRTTDLRNRWTKAGCEDLPLFGVLVRARRKLAFVPTQLMISREEYSLAACLRFINRQFVWTRLYHPLAWWGGAVLYAITFFALASAVVLAITAAVRGNLYIASYLGMAVAGYLLVECVLVISLEMLVRSLLAGRQEEGCRLRLRVFLAILAAQALTPWMFLRSFLTRRITWRGIAYEIRGRWKIRMEQYEPYRDRLPSEESDARSWKSEVTFPNLQSRLMLKADFERQFIIPPPPPWALERFLMWYEKRCMSIDVARIDIQRPIFLIGLHRSGTTLLQDLMCLHPDVAYINNAMPSFRRCFCASEYLRKKLRLDFKGERMLGDSVEIEAGSPNEGVAFWREWLKEDHYSLEYKPRGIGDFTEQELTYIRDSIKKMIWCFGGEAKRFFCKNPSLIPHLELLRDLFPDAKFIHIIRDARTCANSMVKLYRLEQAQLERIRAAGRHGIYDTQPYVAFPRLRKLSEYVDRYGADSIQTTARLWNDAIEEVSRVKDSLPNFYEVRFEDILESPIERIGNLFDFCELPPISKDHHKFWEKLAKVGQIRHSNQYSNYDVIEELCAENLARYGYCLSHSSLTSVQQPIRGTDTMGSSSTE